MGRRIPDAICRFRSFKRRMDLKSALHSQSHVLALR